MPLRQARTAIRRLLLLMASNRITAFKHRTNCYMKIAPGYASLPARFASIIDCLKQSALEAMRTQGFSEESFMPVAAP